MLNIWQTKYFLYRKLINIAPVLNTLTGKHYKNFKVALEIAELKKEISSKVEFYMTQEKDIADTYAMKDDKGQLIIENGSQIKFENSEKAINFNKAVFELKNTEVEIKGPIEIDVANDFREGEDTLTPDEIVQLSDIISFKLPE